MFYKDGNFYLEQSKEGDRVEITEEYHDFLLDQQYTHGMVIYDDNGYPKVKEYVIPEETKLSLEIDKLKESLSATDYQAIKFAEGELSEAEFAPVREQRKTWRARINEIEKDLQIG